MTFFTAILITILSSYLSFTDKLALEINSWLPISQLSPLYTTTPNITDIPTTKLTELSSEYASIPRILIENSSYQSAAAIEALSDSVITKNPLDALVNIYCIYTHGEKTRAVTGTGTVIDSDGIILTNAHVAQFLLLEGILGKTNCVIRTGNPAVPTYEVALLYISPAWIMKHAHLITAESPRGTGERDYALLYITAGLNSKPMPRHFPAVAINHELVTVKAENMPVTAAGYPAESLFKDGNADALLIPRLATTRIAELMTFGSNKADIVTIAGSAIGEQGSSGGPVMNANNELIGLISTRGNDAQFGAGSLRALTLSYIARTYEEETGVSFTQGLTGNLPYRAKLFRETMSPILELMLQQELNKVIR